MDIISAEYVKCFLIQFLLFLNNDIKIKYFPFTIRIIRWPGEAIKEVYDKKFEVFSLIKNFTKIPKRFEGNWEEYKIKNLEHIFSSIVHFLMILIAEMQLLNQMNEWMHFWVLFKWLRIKRMRN